MARVPDRSERRGEPVGQDDEDLSSQLTFVYKFLFPTLWIGGFAFATLMMFGEAEDSVESVQTRWLFLAVTLVGTTVLLRVCAPLKEVSLVGRELVISNFRRTIRVPLREVEGISASILITPELVWLRFRRPTEFGSRIVFMAKYRPLAGFTRPPVVERLNELLSDPDVLS